MGYGAASAGLASAGTSGWIAPEWERNQYMLLYGIVPLIVGALVSLFLWQGQGASDRR